jgi:hypothetical protein
MTLVDAERRAFIYRSSIPAWLPLLQQELWDAIQKLCGDVLLDIKAQKYYRGGDRGPHLPLIIGHHRQYLQVSYRSLTLQQAQ